MSITLPRFDGVRTAQVEGPLDPALPLVVLLHGLGGTSLDMTDPLTARPGTAFDRTAPPPPYADRGFHPLPPLAPVEGFGLDPPATSLTSWQTALNAAGLSTVVYSQSGPLITNDASQLAALAAGPLSTHPDLAGLRIAFVAHSRGGLVARAFLTSAATDPALAGFLARVTALVTLHSPHLGSGVASLAAAVDALLGQTQMLVAATGTPAPAFLAMLRGMVLDPATAELVIGTPTATPAPGEPVPGVSYHTFGGTSTVFARLWATAYTPDSYVPWPVPFPLFHRAVMPVLAGAPLDAASFAPAAVVLAPVPPVTALMVTLGALVATTPELAPGVGDLLVTDARSRLPFSASHTTNPLNHAEALWDPALQAQVVAILARLRAAPPPPAPAPTTARAVATIDPYPVRLTAAPHTVTATDGATGAAVTGGTVTVHDPFGDVALQAAVGAPFTFAFRGRRVITVGADGRRQVETVHPTVSATLPAPYGTVDVDTGR